MSLFRNPFIESRIHTLNRDGCYWNGDHPESESYRRMVTRAYENAYPEDAKRDITGRSRAKAEDPASFDIGRLDLAHPVSAGGANHDDDVAKARHAFEVLGLLERGRSRIKDVTSAIRGFQHMFELEPDGLMNPGGETVKTLRDTFGPREKPPARVLPYRPGGDGGKFTVLTGYLGKSDAGGEPKGGSKDGTKTPLFDHYREKLRQWEGGMANRDKSEDPGDPTMKGISQRFLDSWHKQNLGSSLPKDSKDLSEEQVRYLYKKEFFDKPKIQKVADVPGVMEQAPELPAQLFDAGVHLGPKKAGQMLQQSLDQHVGTDLRVTDERGNRVYDGNVGPKTRDAIARAIREGKIREVNDTMAEKRIRFMKRLPNFPFNRGWIPRAGSFRINP